VKNTKSITLEDLDLMDIIEKENIPANSNGGKLLINETSECKFFSDSKEVKDKN